MHKQLRWRLAGAMLPGRGLTCMKIWALGEEFSTMRFTILMRVSLSLICSGGRNGRFKLAPLWSSCPISCLGSLSRNRKGQLVLGSPAPSA